MAPRPTRRTVAVSRLFPGAPAHFRPSGPSCLHTHRTRRRRCTSLVPAVARGRQDRPHISGPAQRLGSLHVLYCCSRWDEMRWICGYCTHGPRSSVPPTNVYRCSLVRGGRQQQWVARPMEPDTRRSSKECTQCARNISLACFMNNVIHDEKSELTFLVKLVAVGKPFFFAKSCR